LLRWWKAFKLCLTLTHNNAEAQVRAAGAICHLAASSSAHDQIAKEGAIPLLVTLLASSRVEAARHAAGALWHLEGAKADNKRAIVEAGGIVPLVALLRRSDSPEAQESAAGVLADLAKEKGIAKKMIVNTGGVPPLISLLSSGTTDAQKFASMALWGLTLEPAYHGEVVEAEGVPPLVELMRRGHEAQGYAVATLCNVAHRQDVRIALKEATAVEYLLHLSSGAPSHLRAQVLEILGHFGLPEPRPASGFVAPTPSRQEGSRVGLKAKKTRRGSPRKTPSPRKANPSPKPQTTSRETGGFASHRTKPRAKPTPRTHLPLKSPAAGTGEVDEEAEAAEGAPAALALMPALRLNADRARDPAQGRDE